MILNDATLPDSIKTEGRRLLKLINGSADHQSLHAAGQLAEGVVRGFEVVRALRAADIEALYFVFENAVDARLAELAAAHLRNISG
ncbi:MAG TPA: hypothetical protein VGC62_22915 [Pseudomonas sp.]|uniref:hypothetical protein n=1 Tax=Pseudomonas sp. TaxID=306 RepID=UPI002ED7C763